MRKIFYLIYFLIKSLFVLSDFVVDESNFILNDQYSIRPPFYQNYTNNWLLRNVSLDQSSSSVVLTSSKQWQLGSIWNKYPTTTNSWKVVLQFSIFNDSSTYVDGLALWYVPTSSQFNYVATRFVFGGPNQTFTGLMIAYDTNYDYVIIVYNEKERYFRWENQGRYIRLSSCSFSNLHRKTKNAVITLAVEYVENILKVYYTNQSQKLELCLEKHGLKIPSGYIFGVSAANGYGYGEYEVHSLKFYSDEIFQRELETETFYNYICIISVSMGLIIIILSICLLCHCSKKKEIQGFVYH